MFQFFSVCLSSSAKSYLKSEQVPDTKAQRHALKKVLLPEESDEELSSMVSIDLKEARFKAEVDSVVSFERRLNDQVLLARQALTRWQKIKCFFQTIWADIQRFFQRTRLGPLHRWIGMRKTEAMDCEQLVRCYGDNFGYACIPPALQIAQDVTFQDIETIRWLAFLVKSASVGHDFLAVAYATYGEHQSLVIEGTEYENGLVDRMLAENCFWATNMFRLSLYAEPYRYLRGEVTNRVTYLQTIKQRLFCSSGTVDSRLRLFITATECYLNDVLESVRFLVKYNCEPRTHDYTG